MNDTDPIKLACSYVIEEYIVHIVKVNKFYFLLLPLF